LLGRVSDEVVSTLYRGASAFSYVSLSEGFGIPPLEAMAHGIPVVCSAIPSLIETAAPGGAIMVDPFDEESIAQGLEDALDAEAAATARRVGPQWTKGFTWTRTAEATVSALRLALHAA
jgi:glycosyltransferase involved in cell wall biosynthesis